MSAIWSLVPLPFLNPVCACRSTYWFMYWWSLAWRILTITLLALNEHSCTVVWSFFGIGMKTDLFQSSGHCRIFQIYWHIEYNILIASSYRIWNRSAGIPSPPFALSNVSYSPFGFTFQEVQLLMNDHTIIAIWVIKIFLILFCVFLPCLPISSASVRPELELLTMNIMIHLSVYFRFII